MSRPVKPRGDIRTTVSFSARIWKMIQTEMKHGGFNENVSAFLAQCVREHHQRNIELELAAAALSAAEPGTPEKPNPASTIAQRIIADLVRRARSREPNASAYELLAAAANSPRVIQGFAPRPEPAHPTLHPTAAAGQRPVVPAVVYQACAPE